VKEAASPEANHRFALGFRAIDDAVPEEYQRTLIDSAEVLNVCRASARSTIHLDVDGIRWRTGSSEHSYKEPAAVEWIELGDSTIWLRCIVEASERHTKRKKLDVVLQEEDIERVRFYTDTSEGNSQKVFISCTMS
jgi:hypothetical protein